VAARLLCSALAEKLTMMTNFTCAIACIMFPFLLTVPTHAFSSPLDLLAHFYSFASPLRLNII
jgi:hypothetical protein